MKLRTKLILAQIPAVAALIVIGVIGIRTIGNLGAHGETILRDNYRSVLAAQRMKESLERMDSAVLFKLLGRWERGEALAEENRRIFEAELAAQEGNITEQNEAHATENLRVSWSEYQRLYDSVLTVNGEAGAALYYAALYPSFLRVKQGADDILNLNQDAMVRKSDRVRTLASSLNTVMVISTMAALAIAFLVTFVLTRRILRPLSVLTQSAQRIGSGDLAARAMVQGGDEIALLAEEFNTMADHIETYRRSSLGDLLQAQQTAQAVIDSLPDPVAIFGADGTLINLNAAAEHVLGLSLSADGSDPMKSVHKILRESMRQAMHHVLNGKGPYVPKDFDEAVSFESSDGERWFLPRAHPLYEMEQGITGVAVVLQDVTRFHRMDELQNDLVSTVAHELRTPLTSLHMAIYLCLEENIGPLNAKQADLLYAARDDCHRMESMMKDLLDISRIQSGRMEMRLHAVSAQSVLQKASAYHQSIAADKGVTLTVEAAYSDTGAVFADSERIEHVINNLVVNAIRHTRIGGSVTLKVLPLDDAVRFEVVDTGEGIPLEFQQRVFDKFFRVPGSHETGAGLGLSISREIVEAHGGEIGVSSAPGEGSTFWFTLPRSDAAKG